MGICGSIPTPTAGTCASNTNGIKCNGITDNPKIVNYTYSIAGNHTAKVIAERGTATPAESRYAITVNMPTETVSTPSTPSGTTSGATGTSYSYTTGGSVSNLGNPVQYLFDWGDGANSGWLPVGTTNAAHAWSLAGTFSIRSQARSSTNTSIVSGWSTAFTVNISAPQQPPTVTTGSATGIGQTSATLNGTVNPNGASTTVYFQYGTTSSYGSQTPLQTFTGSTSQPVTQSISNLSCGTTYHFNIVASNVGGPNNGVDTTFPTGSCPTSFNYSLFPSGNITVTRGASGSNSITATLVSGQTQSVSFSTSGLGSVNK